MGIPIGTVITLIVYAIGIIVGYVKLQSKVDNMDIKCKECRAQTKQKLAGINNEVNNQISKMHDELKQIRDSVSKIGEQLARMSGLIEMYIKMNNKQ